MSDKSKTELFLENWFPENIPNDDYDKKTLIASWDDCEEMLESYTEQHLKDVLGDVEQLIFKESEAYKERTTSKLELQRIGFKHGAYWLLNLLKQRTNEK